MRTLTALALSTAAALTAPALGARTVFNEDFDNAVKNSTTTTDVYTIVADYNWYTFSPSTSDISPSTTGNPSGGLAYTDTGSGASRLEQNLGSFDAFDTANAADATITFSFDLRVDSYSSGSGGSNPRFVIKDSTRTNPFFVVGFSRGASQDAARIFLFGADTASTGNGFSPTLSDAIGYNTTAGTWASGFDFGTYSTTTANNDTNDEFYRLAVTFNPFNGTSQNIDVTATQLSTGNTATLTRTVTTPYAFSKNAADGIAFNNGGSSTGVLYIDNINASVVPEPAALSLLAVGGLALGRRRKV